MDNHRLSTRIRRRNAAYRKNVRRLGTPKSIRRLHAPVHGRLRSRRARHKPDSVRSRARHSGSRSGRPPSHINRHSRRPIPAGAARRPARTNRSLFRSRRSHRPIVGRRNRRLARLALGLLDKHPARRARSRPAAVPSASKRSLSIPHRLPGRRAARRRALRHYTRPRQGRFSRHPLSRLCTVRHNILYAVHHPTETDRLAADPHIHVPVAPVRFRQHRPPAGRRRAHHRNGHHPADGEHSASEIRRWKAASR